MLKKLNKLSYLQKALYRIIITRYMCFFSFSRKGEWIMTTYAEQVRPYINFKSKDEMDKHFNLFRQKHRFEFTEKENKALFTLNGFAMKFPGACKVEVEKIAKAAGVSVATAKRAFAKADRFGMLKRFKTRKQNGRRQGVTVYQFQHFELELDTQTTSDRQDNEKPCERKGEDLNKKPYSLILLLPSFKKSLKDFSNQKDGTTTSKPKIDQAEKKLSLRQRIAQQLKVRNCSVKDIGEFAKIAYGQIKKLLQQDATIPKTYAEELVYKKFLVAIEHARNPFALFSYLIKKEFDKLLGQSKDEKCELELEAKRGVIFDLVPQFMIDNEQNPVKKARLIKQNEIAMRQRAEAKQAEQVPEWMEKGRQQQQNANKHTEVLATNNTQQDNAISDITSEKEYFAIQQAQFLKRLAQITSE